QLVEIQIHAVFVVGQHFAEGGHADGPGTRLKNHVLQLFADHAGGCIARPPRGTLVTKTAQITFLFGFFVYVGKARNVKAVRTTPGIIFVFHTRQHTRGAHTIVVVHQVMAQLTTVVTQAVREALGTAVKQNGSGADGAGVTENNARADFQLLTGFCILNLHARCLASFRVVDNFVNNAVGANGQQAGFFGDRQSGRETAEIGTKRAAAPAAVASQTLAALALVHLGIIFTEVGDTTGSDHATGILLGHRFTHVLFGAVEREGLEELAIRHLLQAFGLARNPHKGFNLVVPGFDIGVANRPIDGDTFFFVGFKIDVAPAVAVTAPHDGPATHMMPANPVKALVFIVGVFVVFVDPVFVGLAYPPVET